jgi:hypothetical protein
VWFIGPSGYDGREPPNSDGGFRVGKTVPVYPMPGSFVRRSVVAAKRARREKAKVLCKSLRSIAIAEADPAFASRTRLRRHRRPVRSTCGAWTTRCSFELVTTLRATKTHQLHTGYPLAKEAGFEKKSFDQTDVWCAPVHVPDWERYVLESSYRCLAHTQPPFSIRIQFKKCPAGTNTTAGSKEVR